MGSRVVAAERGKISISQPFPPENGRPQSIGVGQSKRGNVVVVNTGLEPVVLSKVRVSSETPRSFVFLNEIAKSLKSVWKLEAAGELRFELLCRAQHHIGLHEADIIFEFEQLGSQKIVVSLLVDDDVSGQLVPSAPFVKPKRPKHWKGGIVCPGVPPTAPNFVHKLKQYSFPEGLNDLLSKSKAPPVLLEKLTKKNYFKYFSMLLFAEELKLKEEMNSYDMTGVLMRRSGKFLVLEVPGLAEGRLSLTIGDWVVTGSGFQGFVHNAVKNELLLMFDKSFKPEQRYDIRFIKSRVNLRKCHQAIEFADRFFKDLCFPAASSQKLSLNRVPPPPLSKGTLNQEQMDAVRQILQRDGGGPAYIIFGPPGTGKTSTVVEAILQVLRANPSAFVLACAPSNSASDLLVERLSHFLSPSRMLRLNAFSRKLDRVPATVLPFCHFKQSTPSREEVVQFTVVVCTYSASSLLHAVDVPAGHFTHIFLDEAGQATEPETLIAVATLGSNQRTVVVLAGDHQQLPPLVKSNIAAKHGLSKSLLERLITSPPYGVKRNGSSSSSSSVLTKLVRNYRSHPDILKVPSELFYGGKLVACAGSSAHSLSDWNYLPKKGFQVRFVAVAGKAEREGNDFSWFNPHEVSTVVKIVSKLLEVVKPEELGIISMYRQQAKKIRQVLGSKVPGSEQIKVGSVEEFQGVEYRVVIISTVRSGKQREQVADGNAPAELGFVSSPKRINVALTRAQALLVVVGSPTALGQDPTWKKVLEHCQSHGAVRHGLV